MAVYRRLNRDLREATQSRALFDLRPNVGLSGPSIYLLATRTRSFFFRIPSGTEDPRWIHCLPEEPTFRDRFLFPFLSFAAWMRLLCDNFDWRFIAMIVFGQHLLKGLLAGGGSGGLLVVEGLIYMRLQVGASMKTVYQAVGSSAWGLKPLYALISDVVSIHGYRRAPWIVVTAVVATVSYFALSLESRYMSGAAVCGCFFFSKLQLSWTDLMIEATYTEKMEEVPQYAADIVSFAWSGVGLFGMAGILIAGPGVDAIGPTGIIALAIPFSAVIIVPALMGYLTEKKLPAKQRGLRVTHIQQQWNYFLCTLILIVGVIITIITGILRVDSRTQALVAGAVCTVTALSAVALLPPTIWKPLLYMFVVNASSLATGGFVDNFYLDPATREESKRTGFPVCVNCPHFSATFYYTVIGVVDSLFMMIGSYIFSQYMSKWTYRSALFLSTVLNTATCFLDIVQYQRWNLIVGLPDWLFMLGKASVQNTLGMINFMPTTILISKVCPHGIEATVYALLAGFSNFGRTIAGYLGAYALTLVGMDHIGTGEVDDFSNAWKAVLVGALSAPIAIFLLPFLIPDASMNEELQRVPSQAEPDESTRLVPGGSDLFMRPSASELGSAEGLVPDEPLLPRPPAAVTHHRTM